MGMREDFEKWALSENWITDKDSFGECRHGTARDGWAAWQAATLQAAERMKEEAAKVCAPSLIDNPSAYERCAIGKCNKAIRAIDVNKLFGE